MTNEIIKSNEEASPSSLIQLAVEKNIDIDKLERLLSMKERYDSNLAHKEFLSAMCKFQSICPPLEKSKKVAFGNTRYSYAPLGEIAATIKQSMSDCGLTHRWEIEDAADKITCTCIISHVMGHSEKTKMSATKDSSGGKNEIQQRGSSITYLQRYTLIAALGISTADEDIDGRKEEPVYPKENNHAPDINKGDGDKPKSNTISKQGLKSWLNPGTVQWDNAFKKLHSGEITMDDIAASYRISIENSKNILNPNFVFEPKTTHYNHRELGTAEKPLITNTQFKQLMERIRSGEHLAYEKAIEIFSFETMQKNLLEQEIKKIRYDN